MDLKNIRNILYGFCVLSQVAMAKIFGESAVNYNAGLIDENNYIQNMFAYTPMGGGTQVLHNYSYKRETAFQKLFEDGTWNAWGGGSAWVNNPVQASKTLPNGQTVQAKSIGQYAYGASIWGQTGRYYGFSFGTQFSAANPFFAGNLNGEYQYGYYGTMPVQSEQALNQLYVEYQYANKVQADVGWITISESPWLVPAAALGHIMPSAAYQGGQVSVYPGAGWILHGIAFNAAQLIGQSNFTGMNFYNSPVGYGNGLIPEAPNSSSAGTVALGANYKALNNNLNVRLWGYSFENYSNLLYADSSLDMHVNDLVKFNVQVQGGNTSGNSATNGLTSSVGINPQVNSDFISSNFAGAMASITVDWAQIGAAATTMWGPEGSFGNGQFVSPYTPAINTDPIFSNSWNYNNIAVNSATSQGIKAFTKFTFLDGNLWINPTYATYVNTSPQWNGTQEWDVLASYSIPQVKGLNIFNVFIYELMPDANPSPTLISDQIVIGYTY
jgi:hypothetical protein